MTYRYDYDRDARALHIELSDKPYAYGRDLDTERRIDYAADGSPVGIEITCVTAGVDVQNLPAADEVRAILQELHLPMTTEAHHGAAHYR